MNIYWPPGHPGDFLTTAFAKLADWGVKTLFIGGDFNCHLCPIIDKFPTGKSLLSTQAKTVRALCEDFDYVDIWRTCHPAEQEYTFFSRVHSSYTRIDYLFSETSASTKWEAFKALGEIMSYTRSKSKEYYKQLGDFEQQIKELELQLFDNDDPKNKKA